MFRKLLLTLCITVAAFLTNAQSTKTPLQFNDDLVSITHSLFAKGQEWGRTFNEAYKSGNYTTLKPVREGLQKFVDEKLQYLHKLKDVNNSKPLRLALIDFLNYEKKLAKEAFMPFEALTSNSSKEEVQALAKNLRELAQLESEKLA